MHTVRAGDTLYMLARQYKITLDELMKANPNLDPYNLRIGMQLCIPASSNEGTAGGSHQSQPIQEDLGDVKDQAYADNRVYKTQRGDTLTRILDRYEITFAALQSSNPGIDFTDSLEEMSLCIPSEDRFRTCPMSGAYIVKSGDSLDSISKKLLVITDSLLMANPTLTIEDFGIPGTKVCIPNS
jgi:LysM repeat protein